MKKIIHTILLSCIKATELIERRIEGEVSVVQRIQLYLHRSLCASCEAYDQQAAVLHKVLKHADNKEIAQVDLDKIKTQIISKISH